MGRADGRRHRRAGQGLGTVIDPIGPHDNRTRRAAAQGCEAGGNMVTQLSRRVSLVVLAVGALSLTAGEPKPDNKIEIRVVAILAHNRNDKVDPKLVKMAAELRKAVPQLTGFDMGKQSCKSVAVGGSETFELVD